MPEKYFYKGYEILPMVTHVLVKAPAYRNKVVKVTKSTNEAKLWIEQVESMAEVRASAKKIDEILAKPVQCAKAHYSFY